MSEEVIEFKVNGSALNHVGCKLSESAEGAVRDASFDVAYIGPGLPCNVDDEVIIKIGDDIWGTGFVRDVAGSHDDENRDYAVSFVSKTCDATECSVVHETGLIENADLKAIAEEFDSLGIGIEADVESITLRAYKVRPGETLFETIEPVAAAQAALIHDTPEGKIRLADKPEGRHAGTLKRGVNILAARGTLSGATSFSEVTVRGQVSHGVDASSLRPEAKTKSVAVRDRPLIKLLEGEATSERVKKRAEWEARRAAGNGIACSIDVVGCRDAAGELYKRNYLIDVDDDWIGVKQDMIIASVDREQDSNGGTITTLKLKDPRSLGGDNPQGDSASGWAAPSTESVEFSAR